MADITFSEDFEGLVISDPNALAMSGWTVFSIVFNGPIFLYSEGPFPAPNGGSAYSAIVAGEGGPDQGAQQLSVYNDYDNPDHGNGFLIESLVYQERAIGVSDVGETLVFRFDAKRGDIGDSSTAYAFIRTVDPNSGFAITSQSSIDTTSLPSDWANYQMNLEIDGSHVGQLLWFGFSSTASNFEPSGNFYDNVEIPEPDTDEDGVPDSVDNCTLVSNADQRDTNGDGIGNVCDADLDENCIVNFLDKVVVDGDFFSAGIDTDFNGDGVVNFLDLGILWSYFFSPPGPSAFGCN